MARIGYIRVSTNDQNTELQKMALISANCDHIFEDRLSGKKEKRPGLQKALKVLKKGDVLIVWKLDRLGRSVKHLVTLVSALNERGVHFHSITDCIDTSSPMGRFFFHIMSALAEMERELIIERTRAGLAAARAQGRIGGRPRAFSESMRQRISHALAQGASRAEVSRCFGVALPTVYRYFPVKSSG